MTFFGVPQEKLFQGNLSAQEKAFKTLVSGSLFSEKMLFSLLQLQAITMYYEISQHKPHMTFLLKLQKPLMPIKLAFSHK